MKKGSKLCHIMFLDGSVYQTFFDETVRKALNNNACNMTVQNKSDRKTGLFRSIDETHFEEIAICVDEELAVPEVF